MITKVHPIGILVEDLDKSIKVWEGLGLKLRAVEDVPSHGVRVAFFPLGETEIELVMPVDPNSAMMNKVKNKQVGLDHLCLEVEDIEESMHQAVTNNIELRGKKPVTPPGRKVVFLKPSSLDNVLVEFYELLP